jgi:hypothetical protein
MDNISGPSTSFTESGPTDHTNTSDAVSISSILGTPLTGTLAAFATKLSSLMPDSLCSLFEPAPPACEVDEGHWPPKLTSDPKDIVIGSYQNLTRWSVGVLWSCVLAGLRPCRSPLSGVLPVSGCVRIGCNMIPS